MSREDLHVGTEWVLTGRCRLRRQIVTETRQIEVTIRREVLVVDGVDLGSTGATFFGTAPDGELTAPPTPLQPLVIVLREQVPEVVLHTRPYEQVTAQVVVVDGSYEVTADVRHERVQVATTAAAKSPEHADRQ